MAAIRLEQYVPAPSRLAESEDELARRLYERHHRKILAFCRHQLGNREEAEDAPKTTFLNAYRGLKRGTSPEFESAWLYKIAHNVCLTIQRNSHRRRLVEAPNDFELLEERVPAYAGDTDELFGLTRALRVLPEQQRRGLPPRRVERALVQGDRGRDEAHAGCGRDAPLPCASLTCRRPRSGAFAEAAAGPAAAGRGGGLAAVGVLLAPGAHGGVDAHRGDDEEHER